MSDPLSEGAAPSNQEPKSRDENVPMPSSLDAAGHPSAGSSDKIVVTVMSPDGEKVPRISEPTIP